jgi:hypothetical protein
MTKFTSDVVFQLTQIKVRASRGAREAIRPFDKRDAGLCQALKRAEKAYLRACRADEKLNRLTKLILP